MFTNVNNKKLRNRVTGSGNAKLSEITEVFEDVGGGQFMARGGMITDVNGNIAGYLSTNTGDSSSFDILSENFRVGTWENGKFKPSIDHYNNKTLFRQGWINASVLQVGDGDTYDLNGNLVMTGARFALGDPLQSGNAAIVQGHFIDVDNYARLLLTSRGYIKISRNHSAAALLITSVSSPYQGGTSIKTEATTGQANFADGVAPFTGKHSYLVPLNLGQSPMGKLFEQGDLYKQVDVNNAIFYAKISTKARNRLAIGAFSQREKLAHDREQALAGISLSEENHLRKTHTAGFINALGEGLLWVCSVSGNIEAGQWLCSSNKSGHAMLQTHETTGEYEPYFTDYTVAKSSVSVDWSQEPDTSKLIPVYYKGG